MLIEQIVEFKLSGRGPPGRTCTSTTGYFYDKNKNLYDKSSSRLFFTFKILHERHCILLSPIWAKSLTKFNFKMQDFKLVLDLNCEQKED